jgi:hypothetical protein
MPKLRPTPTEVRTLSQRDESLLASLASHQFLTFSQVHRLHFHARSETPARRALHRLADQGLAGAVFEWTPYGRQSVWYATAQGEVAAGIRLPGTRRRRSEHLGLGKLAHTLSVNEFCTRLVEESRRRGDHFSWASWRNEVALRIPKQGLLIPDAVLLYELADGGGAYRFLELDTGSMGLDRVGVKFSRYKALYDSGAWKAHYSSFPKVATVLGGWSQERRLRRLLQQAGTVTRGAYGAVGVEFLFATERDLAEHGALGRIWWWAKPYREEPVRKGFFADRA